MEIHEKKHISFNHQPSPTGLFLAGESLKLFFLKTTALTQFEYNKRTGMIRYVLFRQLSNF